MDDQLPPPDVMMGDPMMMPPTMRKNYFASAMDSATGFKYRVDTGDVVRQIIDRLRGMTGMDKLGRPQYDPTARQMNDTGLSQMNFLLSGLMTKNTVLTNFVDEERINRQMKSILTQGIIPALALNRREWEIRNPDIVLQVIENAIYTSFLRGMTGFEAELSSKSHHVMESVQHQQPSQSSGFIGRLFGSRRF